MKKFIKLGIISLAALSLVACSNTNEESNQNDSSTTVNSNTSTVETTTQSSETEAKSSYINDVLPSNYVDNSYAFTFTGFKKIDSSLSGDKIVAIEMEYTNNSNTPTSPYMAFTMTFSPQQTDGVTTETLLGANGQLGNYPDQSLVEMGDKQVNPGATVKAVIGYKLSDENIDAQFIVLTSQLTGNLQGFVWRNED